MKYPPYGKNIARLIKYGNFPVAVDVFVGPDAWDLARDEGGMVWDGGAYDWPVGGCFVLMWVADGPDVAGCVKVARSMLDAGAVAVCVWFSPEFRDNTCPGLSDVDGMISPIVVNHGGVAQLDMDDLRGLSCAT